MIRIFFILFSDSATVFPDFVETSYAKTCSTELEKRGMIILIGEQGCGKTMIAEHIMYSKPYTGWTKQDIQNQNLKKLKPKDRTFLYIDDLFDGYTYETNLKEWWDSLFSFYSRYLEKSDNVRLIITIKDTVMKKVRVFINKKNLNETFFLWANSEHLKLSVTEKQEILQKQYELARKQKNIDNLFIKGSKRWYRIMNEKCPIGFPLCAHMYASEEIESKRKETIFSEPREYVKDKIEYEMKHDPKNDVKTLLLLLLFEGSLSEEILKKEKQCEQLLKDRSSGEMINQMNLSFGNLCNTAKKLNGVLFRKHGPLYKFKHHIHLEGACDILLQQDFFFGVQHFPLCVLRICELPHVSQKKLDTLRKRLKEDFKKGDFRKVLECDILKTPRFQEDFCSDLLKEQFLQSNFSSTDITCVFKFPMIFWASKYNLHKLLETFLKLAEEKKEDERLHFYIAMFGKCCEDSEHYINCIDCPPKISEVQKAVFKFKNSEGKTILHLLISSDMLDTDVHKYLTKLISMSSDLKIDTSLLDCLKMNMQSSRLLCLIEILNKLQETSKQDSEDHVYVTKLIALETKTGSHLELECLCRICILVVYSMESFTENTAKAFFKNTAWNHNETALLLNDKLKNDMAYRIKQCIQAVKGNSFDSLTKIPKEKIPFLSNMTPDLQAAIEMSIKVLAKQEVGRGFVGKYI